MPRYYCDYCDTYLTHDSPSVRKQHNAGYKHKANVRSYYQQFEEQQTQSLIDQRIKEHLGQAAAFQQVGAAFNQHLMGRPPPRLPILPTPVMPMPGGAPFAGIRPPVLPRPIAGAPGYMAVPGMTSPMMAAPGAPSMPGQVSRPPPMVLPPGSTVAPPPSSVSAVVPPVTYPAPPSGSLDSFNSPSSPEANA